MSTFQVNGYTCALCKAWVPSGSVHTCSMWKQAQPLDHWLAQYVRIANALERIADALTRSNETAAPIDTGDATVSQPKGV